MQVSGGMAKNYFIFTGALHIQNRAVIMSFIQNKIQDLHIVIQPKEPELPAVHLESELAALAPQRATMISIGVFDGVHTGHQELLKRLVEKARFCRFLSVVITFRQHPQRLFSPQNPLSLIQPLEDRIELIRSLGADLVLTLDFDSELARLDARAFTGLLQRHLNMQGLVLGWDFAMGRRRQGSLQTLEELGKRFGFSTEVVGAVTLGGEIVSSTAVRGALAAGDTRKTNAMLGRAFGLRAKVVRGSGRGRELGFATANLETDASQALPADGVYAGLATVSGRKYQAAVFIGRRPTFNGLERIVEVHLLDFATDIYGSELKVDIIEHMRGEQKFESVTALKNQIAQDIKLIRERLAPA
jgi:riboflavin kinase/FMN adenylyltransferase